MGGGGTSSSLAARVAVQAPRLLLALLLAVFGCIRTHGRDPCTDAPACDPAPAADERDAGRDDGAAATAPVDAASDAVVPTDSASVTPPHRQDTIDVCGTAVSIADFVEPGRELIVDMHALHLTPIGVVGPRNPQQLLLDPYDLPWLRWPSCPSPSQCVDRVAFEEMILDGSDTAVVINAGIAHVLPAPDVHEGLSVLISNTDLFHSVDRFNRRAQAQRVRFAPAIMPNDRLDRQLEEMRTWSATGAVTAWLLDPAWPAPNAVEPPLEGYWLDGAAAGAVIEEGIELGVPIFLVRKGMPHGWHESVHTNPRDIGPAARAHPQASFVVLQSAFEHGLDTGDSSAPDPDDPHVDLGWGPGVGPWPEGPYDEHDAAVQALYPLDRGVNSLVASLRAAGLGPGDNVYASLDGVWAQLLQRPVEAAHVLGKLLLHVGEDNIVWGTQSTLTGSPTVLIEAFRQFEIPAELRAQYGYPELTPERRAKILGLNAARLLCLDPTQWRPPA